MKFWHRIVVCRLYFSFIKSASVLRILHAGLLKRVARSPRDFDDKIMFTRQKYNVSNRQMGNISLFSGKTLKEGYC